MLLSGAMNIDTHLRTNDSTRAVRSWRDILSFFLIDSGCSSKATALANALDSLGDIGVALTLAGTKMQKYTTVSHQQMSLHITSLTRF